MKDELIGYKDFLQKISDEIHFFCKDFLPEEFILGDATPAPLEKLQGQFRFHILIRGAAIIRLSRLVRETLDKLPFPEDVTVTVDVDPYQLL